MASGPVRVLHLTHAAARNRVLAAQLDATDAADVDWHVAVLGPSGPLQDQLAERGVPLTALGAPDGRDLRRTVPGLRRLLQHVRPEVVHAHLFWPGLAVEAARSTLRRPPASLYTRHHNGSHHAAGKPVHVRVDRWTATHATHCVAVSEAVRRTLLERDRVPAARVTVVHNGLDAGAVVADAGRVEQWRALFGPGPLAVAVGRLDDEKGYPVLLEAVELARRSHPGLLLAVAGSGPEATRRALEAEVGRRGLDGSVHLLGWQDDVFSLVAAADVFVQASRDEALPQSVMEAAVLGVPTAVTTTGGTREVVGPDHPEVPADDPEALAGRILQVLDRPDEARATARAAAAGTAERFSPSRSAQQHVALYRRLSGRAA